MQFERSDKRAHTVSGHVLKQTRQSIEVLGLDAIPTPDQDDETFQSLREIFGQERWAALPVLDLTKCSGRHGGTGYIDFVRPEDMSAPLMRGTDEHGRPFLAVRAKFTFPNGRVETRVETLFRRYTTGHVWTSGGDRNLVSSAMTNEDIEYFGRLVSGEKCGVRKFGVYRLEDKEPPYGYAGGVVFNLVRRPWGTAPLEDWLWEAGEVKLA